MESTNPNEKTSDSRSSGGREWDVVVVGGGPAGSATAARLGRSGHRVLLLDREEFPRAKPCGECLNPAAVGALEALGAAPLLEGTRRQSIHGWRIHPVRSAPFEGGFPEGEVGLGVARSAFDAALLEHARRCGVEVRTGVRVTDLLWEGERVAGVRVGRGAGAEPIRARLVVGADGLRSVVVRRLRLIRRRPRLRKVALTGHVVGVEGLNGKGELHVLPWGCLGVAAVGGGVSNVTLVAAGDAAAEVAGKKEEFFDAALRELPRFGGAERAGEVLATGPFDWPVRSAVADGALLVGDAAGYYDPFTGQGIYRALRGAELAAEAAERVLGRGDVSAEALASYDRARRREFTSGERLQRVIEAFVSRPALLDAVAGRFRRRPELADALLAATGDLRPASSLLRPSLIARLVL